MSRVLVTGGAGTIGAAVVRRLLDDGRFEVRVSDQREAPAWMRRGVRGPHRRPARPRRGAARRSSGCEHVIHLAAIVGGIANFHKLPHTLLEVNNGLYNALFRAALEQQRGAARLRLVEHGVRARATEFPTTEEYARRTARRRARPTASRSSPASTTAAPLHDEHGLRYSICRPFNAYGPGEMPDDEPGIAHIVPDLIERALRRERPFPIFGSGEQTRTLTHVDDIARGIAAALEHPAAMARTSTSRPTRS